MNASKRKLAVITGAATGIGFDLARLCALQQFDLIIAADEPLIQNAALELSGLGVKCTAVQCDLGTAQGVSQVMDAIGARQVDALLANAGRGLGKNFRDQALDEALYGIHTNIDGTIRLIFELADGMRSRGRGHILISGSICGPMPGTLQAVSSGSRAFLESFAVALSDELKGTGVTVTCLMPEATQGSASEVARLGFEAMMRGELKAVAAFGNNPRRGVSHLAI